MTVAARDLICCLLAACLALGLATGAVQQCSSWHAGAFGLGLLTSSFTLQQRREVPDSSLANTEHVGEVLVTTIALAVYLDVVAASASAAASEPC